MTAIAPSTLQPPRRITLPVAEAVASMPAGGSLTDLFPAAAVVSAAATALAVAATRAAGQEVSCRAGCGACCRELVSISLVEATRLADVVGGMPEPRQSEVRARFADAAHRLEAAGLLPPPDTAGPRSLTLPRAAGDNRGDVLRRMAHVYFAERIPCPFLENESCSVYDDRPLVCREFHVTSPPERCTEPLENGRIDGVVPAVRMSPTLALAAADFGLPVVQVPLVLALEWADRVGEAVRRPRGRTDLERAFTRAVDEKVNEAEAEVDHRPTATDSTVTANIELTIRSRTIRLQVSVPAGPTAPSVVLPLAHALTDTAADIAAQEAAATGRPVTCGPGCAACCRQNVPLAEPEARRVAELVAAMPEPRREAVRRRFDEALRRLDGAGLLAPLRRGVAWADGEPQPHAHEYLALGLPCPLLDAEMCSIYEDRPLACRAYVVTSAPRRCAHPTGGVEVLDLPVPSGFRGMARTAAGLPGGAPVPWVPMALALEWAADHPDPDSVVPGPDLLRTAFAHLTGVADPVPNQ